ncbi:MAG: response regulator [Labilithrix sp.]|nr:response regulator [Labilithrix sp.]MCW5831909.1 response regulator [Labilithrix sp.]
MSESPKVLIVDDVEANLIAMEALLGGLDCVIVRAGSGNDALRWLLRHEFAAMLLDVQMPGMDGFEVARLARMNPRSREVPIIFVTAMLETDENLFLGYESGAVDVLFKPLNAHVLVSKVQVFLELDRSRRRLADEIEAHKRTLADLDAFNYSVSHDLRAPLRPLKGFSEILLEEHAQKLDDEGRRLLSRIATAADKMDHLIDDLLRLSKVSRVRPSAGLVVSLSDLAREIVAELRGDHPDREVDFVAAADLSAHGDASLLRIALENLLRNAWKFTTRSPNARIEVGSTTLGAETVYFVRDNGVGFDPRHGDKLFRAFQRLHSSADFEGTGIGLAIVERVIRHHGGRIWADAATDRGATFFFTLPSGRPPPGVAGSSVTPGGA